MDTYDRKVLKKTGELFVAIPPPIARALNIQKNKTVRFWLADGKAALKPISDDTNTDKYKEAVKEIRAELKSRRQ